MLIRKFKSMNFIPLNVDAQLNSHQAMPKKNISRLQLNFDPVHGSFTCSVPTLWEKYLDSRRSGRSATRFVFLSVLLSLKFVKVLKTWTLIGSISALAAANFLYLFPIVRNSLRNLRTFCKVLVIQWLQTICTFIPDFVSLCESLALLCEHFVPLFQNL